jgi:hypothetical protein
VVHITTQASSRSTFLICAMFLAQLFFVGNLQNALLVLFPDNEAFHIPHLPKSLLRCLYFNLFSVSFLCYIPIR